MIRPLASMGGCQLIRIARGRPSRLITVRSLGEELGAGGEEEDEGEEEDRMSESGGLIFLFQLCLSVTHW